MCSYYVVCLLLYDKRLARAHLHTTHKRKQSDSNVIWLIKSVFLFNRTAYCTQLYVAYIKGRTLRHIFDGSITSKVGLDIFLTRTTYKYNVCCRAPWKLLLYCGNTLSTCRNRIPQTGWTNMQLKLFHRKILLSSGFTVANWKRLIEITAQHLVPNCSSFVAWYSRIIAWILDKYISQCRSYVRKKNYVRTSSPLQFVL